MRTLSTGLHQPDRGAYASEKARLASVERLIPTAFMHQHTPFPSFRAMVEASGAKAEEDLLKPEWDAFVKGHTSFESWQKMWEAAVAAWAKKKLLGG